ncbi:hypothetical protein M3Y94_00567800 [Aphelenchoides besseyi]|nr:hypothetical protein M3Y94_00567800 [Aphelenchoides besseyi]KAI6218123.1 hypothetical protein M3Y95_01186900 [Aphelenchoides besseyi]
MLDEYLVWLVVIGIAFATIQYAAFYIIAAWTVYFFACRLLERIPISRLDDKAVVISGCDSGFGHDLAIKCIKNGMAVFAGCLTDAGIKGILEEAKQIPNGENLMQPFALNLRDPESVKRAREFVDERLGNKKLWVAISLIKGIVNNAGIGDNRSWDAWLEPEMYQRFWDINTLGHIRVTHAFMDLVKKAQGRIVSVSSICAKVCPPTGGPYNVSKHAIAAYCDTIRVELAQWGVHVSVLEPGFFTSPQANPLAAAGDVKMVWDRLPERLKEEYGEHYLKFTQNLVAGYLKYKCQGGSHRVIDAYYSALTSKFPRRRYQIGYDSMFQFTPLAYLSTRIQQQVFYAYLKLIPISVGIFLIQNFAWYLVGAYIVYFLVVRTLEKVSVGNLQDKAVLITGCDSGFGWGLTLKCLRNGMPVFSACFDENGAKRLRDEASKIKNGSDLLTTFTLDVRNDESVNKARELVESKLQGSKGLWGIVNNAGIGDMRGWDFFQTPAVYDRFWQVNALGVIRTTHAFRDMVERTKGRIVNVTSICGKFPTPTLGPYSTSKMAVGGYSDVLRAEMALLGVKVCILEPGFFKTPQANPQVSIDDHERVWNRVPQATKDRYGEKFYKWSSKLISEYLEYKCKPGAEFVVDAYFNALTSVFPRGRYQIGYDSIFQFTPLSYLPTRWQDWLLRGYFTFVDAPPPLAVQY